MVITTTVNPNFNGDYEVVIRRFVGKDEELQFPIVEDGVKWETERQGSPAKLTFKLYKDKNGNLNFQEGDEAILRYNDGVNGWVIVFHGYIFTKKRTKDGWIDVTAYDALRYFKNKATYTYRNKTASEVLKMICEDYKLPIGNIENTKYVISERDEDDQSLLDIIQNALDLTLISTGEKYILFTENGQVCLKNAKSLMSNVVINTSVMEDFDYSSSIDNETYNEIELYYDNDKTNKREYYNVFDEYTMKKWGRLRLTESVQDTANVRSRAENLLKLYNQKHRELKVKEVFGDVTCRAGASAIVQLELGDVVVSNYMIIEKATHTFKKNQYRMDLTLIGFPQDATGETIYNETNVVDAALVEATPVVDLSKQSKSITDATEQIKDRTHYVLKIIPSGYKEHAGRIEVAYTGYQGQPLTIIRRPFNEPIEALVRANTRVVINAFNKQSTGYSCAIIGTDGWNVSSHGTASRKISGEMTSDRQITIIWDVDNE